jgi:hypothetical protein
MIRRLAHYVVDGYGTNRAVTDLVKTTEMWFVPVANPDGYDWTFQPDQRMWRKNLADNDGDGLITPVDGVDPNRNYPTKWGYDNEGSSPEPASETYRGPAPSSEPETRALDGLMAASSSSSSSTTTPPPSCCCGAPAGRCRHRRPTTPSTRR